MIDPVKVKRLALIKHIYTIGLSQTNYPEPLYATAILTFHDAVELFLQLTCEEYDIHEKRINFEDYWAKIQAFNGVDLPHKATMARLNSSRVNFKHHGNVPSKLDIEGFRASVTYFFEESTKLVFGIEFSAISLVELVMNTNVRNKIYESTDFAKTQNLNEAQTQLAISFTMLIRDFENDNLASNGRSIFNFGREYRLGDDFSSRNMDILKENVSILRNIVEILALGIDTKKFAKFRSLTPIVNIYASGDYYTHPNPFLPKFAITQADNQFCVDFVIESAIKLQEFYQ
jgi:hypothetical protein